LGVTDTEDAVFIIFRQFCENSIEDYVLMDMLFYIYYTEQVESGDRDRDFIWK
jgi:hypothetical protein